MRTYQNTCESCGATIAAMTEAEPGTALCFPCANGSLAEPNLVFVGLDTETIDDALQGVVLDLDAFGFVPDGDDYFDDSRIVDYASHHGVPVADLWAAYEWRALLARTGILADVESYIENAHADAYAIHATLD